MALLSQYQELRDERLKTESRRTQNASGVVLCQLQQRLFSSIEAFARTLKVHRKTIERQRETQAAAEPTKRLDENLLFRGVNADDDRATLTQAEVDAKLDAQIQTATELAPAVPARSTEQELLETTAELAEASRHTPDARVRYLFNWIRENMCPGGRWNDTRVILFTEYEDTLRYVQRQLDGELAGTDQASQRIAIYSGEASSQKTRREEIKRAFNTEPSEHPLRILLATDAAREGLNLQAYCHHLFHFDVPWNPSRMEPRNGRIDRKLQPAPEVFCYYFAYINRPEDRILEAVVRKTKIIREQLGSLSQVIDGQLEHLLKHGIHRKDVVTLEQQIDAADLESDKRQAIEDELEAAHERQNELRESIEQLRTMMERSQREVGLDESHFCSAISCALEMLGADPLRFAENGSAGLKEYTLPKLDDRDASWTEAMDSLRAPKDRDQTLYEWRRTSPIRPVVFKDPGRVTESVVQFHLEQRVVQRLLSRFLSQGFGHHDLSRACLAQSQDAVPRVILPGRLALYGPGAARLHEEIVPITARWTHSVTRKTALQPYAREAEQKTLDLLDRALLTGGGPNQTIRNQFLQSAAHDVQELLPYLNQRAEEYAHDAEIKLAARADDEAKKMLEILGVQKKHNEATDRKSLQLSFDGWSEEDRRQQEADRRHWRIRLQQLEREIETEPARIRDVYQVRARRIEPVGLVYLWPETN